MAITPRSKGLGNIGNIVNRQGLAAPTRPVAKPVAPVTNRATTTMAQRQAAPSPFKSVTKPATMPMASQPITDMPMPMPMPQQFAPQVSQPYNPNIDFGGMNMFNGYQNAMFNNPNQFQGDFGGMDMFNEQPGQIQPMDMFGGYQNAMFNSPNVDYGNMNMLDTGKQLMNPDQELIETAFNPTSNTNPSGSLFAAGNFRRK